MALINRLTRLFRADMHAVLDHIEEPDSLLRQAVREMEDHISNDEQRLKLLCNELAQLTQRQTAVRETLDSIEEELDVCFKSDNDDLARRAIRRKLEGERLARHLGQKQAGLESNIDDLRRRLEENRTRLQAMQQKVELLGDDAPKPPTEHRFTPDIQVRDDEVEVAFLREKQRRQPS